MKPSSAAAAFIAFGLLGQPGESKALTISIVPGAGLLGNAEAEAAINRAATAWSSRLTDPVDLTILADFGTPAAGIPAQTTSVLLTAGYNTIRNQVVADATDEADDAVVGFLPTAAQYTAFVPAGRTLNGNIVATKANLKALGFAGLDANFGISDGSMVFNSAFLFDFDRSDGITAGAVDFESVALRELGRALGFISAVDDLNAGSAAVAPFVLDLFRFNAATAPTTNAQFTTTARSLVPGAVAVTSDVASAFPMSTGLTNATFPGTDGSLASTWKADELSGTYLGVMDPTFAPGFVALLTEADFRVLDLMGYEVAVPEPSSSGLLLLGAAALFSRRFRRTPLACAKA